MGSINEGEPPCDGVKISKAAARCNGREAGIVDWNTKRGLRSSSSLRVVAIQAIDIFIRGCYL